MKFHCLRAAVLAACSAGLVLVAGQSGAAPKAGSPSAEHARIVAYWTKERVAAAIPRDLRIDERGYGYLRRPNGALEPYGHTIAAQSRPASPQPMAGPPGGDNIAPSISNRDPGSGATIGATYTFKATVSDLSGIRSVSFKVGPPGPSNSRSTRLPGRTASTARSSPVSRTAAGPGRSSRRTPPTTAQHPRSRRSP